VNPFTDNPALSVGALGERRLIRKLRDWLGAATAPAPYGIGDDCAVLPATGARRLLVTTDPVIYGRHFDNSLSPAAAAEKLLKRNLSDIAAMGGVPCSAVVSLALRGVFPSPGFAASTARSAAAPTAMPSPSQEATSPSRPTCSAPFSPSSAKPPARAY
jgi:hypothetical protein